MQSFQTPPSSSSSPLCTSRRRKRIRYPQFKPISTMSKLSVATIIVCCFHLISHRVNSLSFANTRTFHLYATPASLQTDDVPTTAATSLSSSPTTVSKSTTNKRHKKRHQLRQKNNHNRDNDSPLSYQSYHPSLTATISINGQSSMRVVK